MFFIGVISTLIIVPPLADRYGRKLIFSISNAVALVGQFGLILADSIYEAYFFSFLIGTAFSGQRIVGINYLLEMTLPRTHELIIFLVLALESVSTLVMTAWYQFVDRGWFLLQLICFILACLVSLYFVLVIPESPKWLYTFNRFDESRK